MKTLKNFIKTLLGLGIMPKMEARKAKKRKPGIWTGKVKINKDFDTLPTNFMKHFNCF